MRSAAIAMIRPAMPLKIAPATKYGPKIVECHIGTGAIEKSNDTMVWTDTATGMIAIAMICIADSRRCHCFGRAAPAERQRAVDAAGAGRSS